MELQRLLSLTRKAMDDYQMIQEGDKIAVGISGGKDSLTLLYAMANLRRFYPKKFSLIAITVDLGYEGFDLTPVKLYVNIYRLNIISFPLKSQKSFSVIKMRRHPALSVQNSAKVH